ncbi:MAG: AEC family transporter [Oscillospiraceae bacterium]
MKGYFATVIGQVITLFLLMGVGFLLGRRKKITTEGAGQMTFLLLYVVAGCVMVRAMQTEKNPELLRDLAMAAAVTVGLYVVYALVSLLLFRKQPPDTRDPLRFGVVYGNIGFMGLPLITAILGEKALIFAAVGFVAFQVANWTHGLVLMGGREQATVKKAVLNPGVIALCIGLPLFLMGLRLPPMVYNAVSFLADLNTPLAMVVIGFQMSQADLPGTFRRPVLYQSAGVKLLLMPALTAVLLLPLHLNPLIYSVCVILAGTPTAGVTAMFSQQFHRDTIIAAQSVTLSTLLSAVTLPLWAVVCHLVTG